MNTCVVCNKDLVGHKRLYCSDVCSSRAQHQKNKNAEHVYNQTYGRTHRDKKNNLNRVYRREHRLAVLARYGNKCTCCGETRQEFLAIDHIDGGGNKHRKELGNKSFYGWLIKNDYPAGFRVLCHNCNMALGCYGYCPHNQERQ